MEHLNRCTSDFASIMMQLTPFGSSSRNLRIAASICSPPGVAAAVWSAMSSPAAQHLTYPPRAYKPHAYKPHSLEPHSHECMQQPRGPDLEHKRRKHRSKKHRSSKSGKSRRKHKVSREEAQELEAEVGELNQQRAARGNIQRAAAAAGDVRS